MQIPPKIQDVHDNSEIITENRIVVLCARALSSFRSMFSAKNESMLYTAISKIGEVLKIVSTFIAIILLIPLIVLKCCFILICREFNEH